MVKSYGLWRTSTMSSYDKVVKLACKPKAAPPKAKYLDPIIAATWSEDGAVHDVCKALSPRFREPNAIVVFKALIVLHTMIRNGATDNVLSYLSSADVLRLRNVAHGQWEGYDTPQNLAHYAFYLDSRVRAYRDLKHDAVRVQSESNRDMRVSQSVEDSRIISSTVSGPQRSKTIMGRKLRSMTVEKGLLRETKAVHRVIDALIECRFYLDDLEDELTTTALRMLVKDLLVLFQAGNEGVINVLEHYFEMSHIDAEEALAIYRHFCKQTESVVEYLGVAKKLQNLLNVPIPNLKHAPVSLAGALEEYLKDPNFEQNRLEYKANKAAADGNQSAPPKLALKREDKASTSSSVPQVPTVDVAAVSSSSLKPEMNKAMVDFFASIETEQEKMFSSPTGSAPSQPFQNQTTFNPFVQRQSVAIPSHMTGGFFQQQQPFIPSQHTGFIQPQQTAFQTSPFPHAHQQTSSPFLQLPQQQVMSPFQQQRQSAFLQPQSTGLLQSQATGSNPFRQSMLFPQSTGLSAFTPGGNAFGGGQSQSPSGSTQPLNGQGTSLSGFSNAFQQPVQSFMTSPTSANNNSPFAPPNRPQSTPITSQQKPSQTLTPVATHQTGSKNPFGIPVTPAPPVPKLPTLQELTTGVFVQSNDLGNGSAYAPGVTVGPSGAEQKQTSQPTPSSPKLAMQSGSGGSVMASVASSFSTKPAAQSSGFGSTSSNPFPNNLVLHHTPTTPSFTESSSLSDNPTGSTSQTTTPSISSLQPQQTGFGGIKPFKPSSSFGANLLDSLPPVAGSPASPSSVHPATGVNSINVVGGLPPLNPPSISFNTTNGVPTSQMPTIGVLNAQRTGIPSFGSATNGTGGSSGGLRPQTTGGPNPFRVSMLASSTSGPSFSGSPSFQPFNPIPSSGFSPSAVSSNPTGAAGLNGSAFPGQAPFNQNQSMLKPQNGSLI
ncbi:ANTH domain-containing protein [Gautieria morchelliformis]|nr:ANTH domain-containing protein [Gautieria morchelliformis]